MSLRPFEIGRTLLFGFGGMILLELVYFLLVLFSLPGENVLSYRNNNANVFDLSIPASINFCGEDIPTNDVRIKTILEKEFMQNQYSRSATQLLFNKARRWFPYIEPVLKKEGVPDEFKYLAVIESHLSNVYSRAGAAGFWQLIANSAQANGLVVNETVDERLHVQRATQAACRLIRQAYKVLGNWTLSAAAYNRGINGILRAMKDQGNTDYHQLLLNPETGTFVYRILAYKTLLTNPEHFGISKKALKPLSPIPYKRIKVDSSISDLKRFARQMKVDYTTMKAHNPWLIAERLDNPERRSFEICIPKRVKDDYSHYLNDLHPGYIEAAELLSRQNDSLQAKQTLQKLIIEKETMLEQVAAQYSITLEQLRQINGLDSSIRVIRSGTLLIPAKPEVH